MEKRDIKRSALAPDIVSGGPAVTDQHWAFH